VIRLRDDHGIERPVGGQGEFVDRRIDPNDTTELRLRQQRIERFPEKTSKERVVPRVYLPAFANGQHEKTRVVTAAGQQVGNTIPRPDVIELQHFDRCAALVEIAIGLRTRRVREDGIQTCLAWAGDRESSGEGQDEQSCERIHNQPRFRITSACSESAESFHD
jgi:hypothetical protein